MLRPRLRKHGRNFSWLITGSRDPLSLSHRAVFYRNRFQSHVMSKSSRPVSDLNCVNLQESQRKERKPGQYLSIKWHMYLTVGGNSKKSRQKLWETLSVICLLSSVQDLIHGVVKTRGRRGRKERGNEGAQRNMSQSGWGELVYSTISIKEISLR